MSFLEDNSKFIGTGARNAQGQTLDEFAEAYNASQYDCPCNTVDTMVFAVGTPAQRDPASLDSACPKLSESVSADPDFAGLKLLLIKRSNHPCIGFWALPGGFVDIREDLEDAAARELFEETGVKDAPLIQLGTYGDYDRDPRWRVITTAFLTVLGEQPQAAAGDDAADAAWMDVALDSRPDGTDTLHSLTLRCEERGIVCRAQVRETVRPKGLLEERRCSLVSSDLLCTDHGLIITEGLLWLRNRRKT